MRTQARARALHRSPCGSAHGSRNSARLGSQWVQFAVMASFLVALRSPPRALLSLGWLAALLAGCGSQSDGSPEDHPVVAPFLSTWDDVAHSPRGPRPYFSFFVT